VREWDKTMEENPKKPYKDYKLYFNKIEERALDIIKDLLPFSFKEFEAKFKNTSSDRRDLIRVFKEYIDSLYKEDRIKTSFSYANARNSLKEYMKFRKRKNISFDDITPRWLSEYENWMLANGKSISTVGVYTRSLRTIINIAIDEGNLKREFYPFGKRKYQIPASQNVKKALTIQEIKKIVDYIPKNQAEEKAKDLWMFSYLCSGINFKDIAKLKFSDIDKNKITFIRSKTKHSGKQSLKPITIMLTPEIISIIDKWGDKKQDPKTYVFGIINKNETPLKQINKIQQAIKTVNKYMKRIGDELKLPLKVTTYTARHSYATVLKRSGAPIAFISESLGHSDLKTTENYLDSFDDESKLNFQRHLLNFD